MLNGVYGPALKKFKLHDPDESADRTEKLHKNALKHAHNLTVHLLTLFFGIRALAGKDWVPWYMGGSGLGGASESGGDPPNSESLLVQGGTSSCLCCVVLW